MHKVNILVLLYTLAYINTSNSTETYNKCGRHLGNLLSGICGGNYYSPKFKKSNTGETLESYMPEYEEYLRDQMENFNRLQWEARAKSLMEINFPFKTRENALKFTPTRFRRQAGIVDECCAKPCSIAELKNYCGK